MGIKGIYKELGPGKRVSLSKLSADSLAANGRPLRLAIDIAIWQFQNQAARGGTNPAIRTLFYRLVRLLGTPVEPVFVFDGPQKPKVKRNKRSGRGDGVASALAKRLIRLFGFAVHDAPGEAEAECALLQRHGIVDAVLSEDVDTIMFGCNKTLRNWSAESKTAGAPTHVSLYDLGDSRLRSVGLDREGMVLVALMSGGDYAPEGIPGCGVKVACEAAKAGYGKSLCRLKASDTEGIVRWREGLAYELRTNESKSFRTKHQALRIPEDFPNIEVLRYYTHPVVSPTASLDRVREAVTRRQIVQLDGLREFAREIFDWDFRIGASKFIRVLAPALLADKMWQAAGGAELLVKRISARRLHFSTDATPELRVSFVPSEVVPIDLSREVDEDIPQAREGLALNDDDDFETEGLPQGPPSSQDTESQLKVFDVAKPDMVWILERTTREGAPLAVAAWEQEEQQKAARKSAALAKKAKNVKKPGDMPHGAMDQFVRVIKKPAYGATDSSSWKRTTQGKASKARVVDLSSSPAKSRVTSPPPSPSRPSKQELSLKRDGPHSSPGTSEVNGSLPSPRTPSSSKKVPEDVIIIPSSPPGPAGSPHPFASSPPSVPTSEIVGLPNSLAEASTSAQLLGTQRMNRTSRGAQSHSSSAATEPTREMATKILTPSKTNEKGRYKQTALNFFSSSQTYPASSREEGAVESLLSSPEGNKLSPRITHDCRRNLGECDEAELDGVSWNLSGSPRSPTKRGKDPPARDCSTSRSPSKKKLHRPPQRSVPSCSTVDMRIQFGVIKSHVAGSVLNCKMKKKSSVRGGNGTSYHDDSFSFSTDEQELSTIDLTADE